MKPTISIAEANSGDAAKPQGDQSAAPPSPTPAAAKPPRKIYTASPVPMPQPPMPPPEAEVPPTRPYTLFERLRGSLLEDLDLAGDVTSRALVPEGRVAEAYIVAKQDGILCGAQLLGLIFQMAEELTSQGAAGRAWDLEDAQSSAAKGQSSWDQAFEVQKHVETAAIQVKVLKKDGDRLQKGDWVAEIRGDARAILAGERTALNLICRLSGISTLTSRFVQKVAATGAAAKVLDTRKTTPLWRDLEKYAVKCGGGTNHRRGLHDMILIKDNHLALWGAKDPAGAVLAAKARFPNLAVEVEVTTLEGVMDVCKRSKPEFLLLDNFTVSQLQEAVKWVHAFFPATEKSRPLLEASGGISLQTIDTVALTGVDRISSGALTHGAISLDMSLEMKF